MKFIFLFMSLFFHCCTKTTMIQKNEKEIEKIEKLIIDTCYNDFLNNEIKSFKNQIDSIVCNIKPIHKDLMGYSSEGGEALLYIINNDTLFVSVTFYGEMGKLEEKFYNKNNIPILYERSASIYKTSITTEDSIIIDHVEKDMIIMQNFSIEKWCHSGKESLEEEFDSMSNTIYATYEAIREEQEEW